MLTPRGASSRGELVQVLDEHHLVAALVVVHFVHELRGEQQAEAAGAHARCFALLEMRQRIVFGRHQAGRLAD